MIGMPKTCPAFTFEDGRRQYLALEEVPSQEFAFGQGPMFPHRRRHREETLPFELSHIDYFKNESIVRVFVINVTSKRTNNE
jgi:hypothetical protein